MEIALAEEQAFHYVPHFTIEVAHDRIEQKKTNLVAGTMGALLSRPKPEEIQNVGVENRLEPFWSIEVSSRTAYDRHTTYLVPVSGLEVQHVSLLDHDIVPEVKGKDSLSFSIPAVEHCREERQVRRCFNGMSGEMADLAKYQAFAKTLVVDLSTFSPEGVLVVPPTVRASAVVRQVISEVIKPVAQAHTIHEERVDVQAVELNFLPVYAFDYAWTAKNKRVVVEFDALTGDMRAGGKKLGEQFAGQFKGVVSRDLVFDITADAVGMLVPGGSIAVKLVKAVVDRKKSG